MRGGRFHVRVGASSGPFCATQNRCLFYDLHAWSCFSVSRSHYVEFPFRSVLFRFSIGRNEASGFG